MSTEKMRESFETWHQIEYPGTTLARRSNGEYVNFYVGMCWIGWQSCRAAIEVELRDAYMKGWEASGEGWNGEYPEMPHKTERWQRERDRSLGLKVKP